MNNAFGRTNLHPSNTRATSLGGEARADELQKPFEKHQALSSLLNPNLVSEIESIPFKLGDLLWEVSMTLEPSPNMLLNHFSNDLVILLDRVLDGDGRSAARSARSIYEELVSFAEVIRSPEASERYALHSSVTDKLLNQRRPGTPYLHAREARSEGKKFARTARRSAKSLRDSLNRFGPGFKNRWSKDSLLRMAARNGLSEEYDGYRILSGVMHANSGALSGTRAARDGFVINRLGADLRLSALSYVEGLHWGREFIKRLSDQVSMETQSKNLVDTLELLLSAYPEVLAASRRLDRNVWPKSLPPPTLAVLAVYASGERWLIHEPRSESLTIALPPERLPPGIDQIRERARASGFDGGGGRPISAVFPDLTLEAKPGAKPFPAASLLVAADSNYTP